MFFGNEIYVSPNNTNPLLAHSEIQETWPEGLVSDIGIIAQEVEEIFPEIVETRQNGYKEKLPPKKWKTVGLFGMG